MQKHSKYKKLQEKYQQTIKTFQNIYHKSLQDNMIDKNEYESQCNIITRYVDETKNEFFYKHEHKSKIEFFVIIN